MLDDPKVIRAIRAKLYAINSYFAYQDFRAMNPEKRPKYRKDGTPVPLKSYPLSPVTNEARRYYALALADTWEDDTEQQIKGYMMRQRLSGALDKILAWEEAENRTNPWKDEEGEDK